MFPFTVFLFYILWFELQKSHGFMEDEVHLCCFSGYFLGGLKMKIG